MFVGALIGGGVVVLLLCAGVVLFVYQLSRDREQPKRGFEVIQDPDSKRP